VQVVKLAREMGLIKLGTVAIDGTKIKAHASWHKAMSYERMQQAETELKAQMDALLERAKTTDAAEADELELGIPPAIERREVRLKAINEARISGSRTTAPRGDARAGSLADHRARIRTQSATPKNVPIACSAGSTPAGPSSHARCGTRRRDDVAGCAKPAFRISPRAAVHSTRSSRARGSMPSICH